MKKYILLFFLIISAYSYAAASPELNFGPGDMVTSLNDGEFVEVTSSTVDNIKITYNFKAAKTLKIYNLLGQCVSTVKLVAGSSSVDVTVNLKRGTYIYSLEEGTKTFGAKKFIVK
jgi:hypothetical protein